MESAIYFGSVRHRRFEPVRHEFTYPLFMAFLDIDRIPELMKTSRLTSYERFNWATYRESDHFGDPALPLRTRLETDAVNQGICLPDGPIFLLTHLRYLGYNFNPISIYYFYTRSGRLDTMLAEVNSTFGETHNYWLSAGNQVASPNSNVYRSRKALHVSPFMPMELDYKFVLSTPGDQLVAHMDTLDGEHRGFDATLTMHREPWNAASIRRALIRFPWITAKVISAIHWEALKLYLKKAPVFTHPARQREKNV
jgi:DUF1365 family protein